MRPVLVLILLLFSGKFGDETKTVKQVCAGDVKTPRHSYVYTYAGFAMFSQIKYGVPASIILAQGILESGYGKSRLFQEANNHFGIKCFRKGCQHETCAIFDSDLPGEAFVSFATHADCFDYHGKMLSSGRYKRLAGKTGKHWCDGLERLGYSTGSGYSLVLKQIISKYGLQKYDTRARLLFDQACRIR